MRKIRIPKREPEPKVVLDPSGWKPDDRLRVWMNDQHTIVRFVRMKRTRQGAKPKMVCVTFSPGRGWHEADFFLYQATEHLGSCHGGAAPAMRESDMAKRKTVAEIISEEDAEIEAASEVAEEAAEEAVSEAAEEAAIEDEDPEITAMWKRFEAAGWRG